MCPAVPRVSGAALIEEASCNRLSPVPNRLSPAERASDEPDRQLNVFVPECARVKQHPAVVNPRDQWGPTGAQCTDQRHGIHALDRDRGAFELEQWQSAPADGGGRARDFGGSTDPER